MNRSINAAFLIALATTGCVGTIAESATAGNPGLGGSPGFDDQSGATGGLPPRLDGYDPAFACGSDSVVPSAMRRLTKLQYVNSVREFLSTLSSANLDKVMTEANVKSALDTIPEDSVDKNETILRNIHDKRLVADHVDGMFEVGALLAEQLAASDTYVNELVKVCGTGSTRASLSQATCLDTFVAHYGKKALRRPATAAELADFKASYAKRGLDLLIGSLLVQPRFYYRADVDGQQLSGAEGADATYKLEKYELLSRITFLFWNRPPNDDLYEMAAAATDLPVDEVLNVVFAAPDAHQSIRAFFSDWLHLERLSPLKGITSPAFKTLAMATSLDASGNDHLKAMINEVVEMGEYYTWKDGGRYDDVLTTKYSFARTSDLSSLYGVARWDGNDANMVEFPSDNPRGGLLTRGAMLISSSEYTHPILKGREVIRNVLCETIPPPPPSVAALLVRTDEQTVREETETVLSKGAACGTCHSVFTQLGYLTENYDSLGRYRTEELQFERLCDPADPTKCTSTGSVIGKLPVNTEAVAGLFDKDETVLADGIELGEHVATSGKGHNCLVRQYFRYANAREENEEVDGCGLENMRVRLMTSDGGLMPMFKETVSSQAFRQRKVQ